jgi:hypothetical protein
MGATGHSVQTGQSAIRHQCASCVCVSLACPLPPITAMTAYGSPDAKRLESVLARGVVKMGEIADMGMRGNLVSNMFKGNLAQWTAKFTAAVRTEQVGASWAVAELWAQGRTKWHPRRICGSMMSQTVSSRHSGRAWRSAWVPGQPCCNRT